MAHLLRVMISVIAASMFSQCSAASAKKVGQSPESFSGNKIFESVSSRVSELEARLSETELESKQLLQKHEEQFNQVLKSQREANVRVASVNVQIAAAVEDLRKNNAELRSRAGELQKNSAQWMTDLKSLESNLTTAIEFVHQTVASEDKQPRELDVLAELENQDSDSASKQAHMARLQEISKGNRGATMLGMEQPEEPGLALLQLQRSGPSPKSLLKVLDAGLSDLAAESQRNEAELKKKFKQLMQVERDRYEALMSEQRTLNTTRRGLEDLHGRLEVAVRMLEDTRSHLEERARSIRAYAQRLGIKAVPNQQRDMEAASSKAVASMQGQEQESHRRSKETQFLEWPASETQFLEKPSAKRSTAAAGHRLKGGGKHSQFEEQGTDEQQANEEGPEARYAAARRAWDVIKSSRDALAKETAATAAMETAEERAVDLDSAESDAPDSRATKSRGWISSWLR